MLIRRLFLTASLILLALFSNTPPAQAQAPDQAQRRVVKIDILGEAGFPADAVFAGTRIGGLSGLAYDPARQLYYALSDDRSEHHPARFYTLTIGLAGGALRRGDLRIEAVTTLLAETGQPFPTYGLDPEAIALSGQGSVFISSEGDAAASPPLHPFVNEFSPDGKLLRALPVPEKFLPDPAARRGVRPNLGFESLALSPDRRFLYAAVENALLQDGPETDLDQPSLARLIQYDLAAGQPIREFVYLTDPVARPPDPPDQYRHNGLVELLALDNSGTFLALERSFSTGRGFTIKLYEATTHGALDVSGYETLLGPDGASLAVDPPLAKRLLLDLSELGLFFDNLEGMALGPPLPDGRHSLIIAGDNNFHDILGTRFIGLALTLETVPAVLPEAETPGALDAAEPPAGLLAGAAGEPAIWLHPTDPAQSLVIATLGAGGLALFDLDGQLLQTIRPAAGSRYQAIDLIYNFNLAGRPTDLALVSDRANDSLAVFAIDPAGRRLSDVTAPEMIKPLFGEADKTAARLAAYTGPGSGKSYLFVSQGGGSRVVQLELVDNRAGRVAANLVRTLALPNLNPPEEEASPVGGLAVDRKLGFLYAALADGSAILKYQLEPDGSGTLPLASLFRHERLRPNLDGLTLYYGPDGAGYLIVSSRSDGSYALFERSGDNAYLGSFTIAANGPIDPASAPGGAGLANVALGPKYPAGLLVVRDGANDPAYPAAVEGRLQNSHTNFKFVPWPNITTAFLQPLLIDPDSYNPRR